MAVVYPETGGPRKSLWGALFSGSITRVNTLGGQIMRRISVAVAAVLIPAALFGQGWIDFTSKADFFYVNFPSQPNARDIMYKTQYGISLPGHVYSVDQGASHYSVTVVDYADAQKIHTAGADECKKA